MSGPASEPASGPVAVDATALATWVAEQRWYAANDQAVRRASIVEQAEITGSDPPLVWLLLELVFESGAAATYQLVVDPQRGVDAIDRPEVVRWMFPQLEMDSVQLLPGEQSNTSLVATARIGGRPERARDVIVKVFRRVGEAGERNPDVEIVDGLWAQGYRSVAEPMGTFRRGDRDLAVARHFLRGATSGWDMALDDPWFIDELRALGAVTAELHVVLAEVFGSAPGDAAAWAALMRQRQARVTLPGGLDAGPSCARLAASSDVGAATRIHGDLHLGQVLHHRGRWYVLDFEGEPSSPIAERVAPSSPLRDVAGMLRSFGYAAAVAELPPIWEHEARTRYLQGYRSVEAVAPLLPADPQPVLDAFELDKAIYEVGYERASRPDWEAVPLAAVRRLLG